MKDKRSFAMYLLAVICMVNVFAIIIMDMKYAINSDSATVLLLAKRQMETKQLLPADFHHTTGVFVLTLNLLLVPIMKICHNWVLCRSIAVIIQTIIGFAGILLLWKDKATKNVMKGIAMIILLSLPLSHEILENLYFQAGYYTIYIKIIYALLAIKLYYESEKKKPYLFLMFLTTAVCTLGNMRNVLIYVIPILGACLIVYLIENQWNIIETVKERDCQAIILTTVLGTCAGVGSYQVLTRTISSSLDSYAGIEYTGFASVGEQLLGMVENIFTVYGASGAGSLVTFTTIIKCFCFLYSIIAVFVIPVFVLFQYKKIKDVFHKLLLGYTWISNFAVIYMAVFTTANTERYLLPVYFNCMILFILSLEFIKVKIPKNMDKIIGVLVLLFVVASHSRVWISGIDSFHESDSVIQSYETLHDKIKTVLEDENVKYGYAGYWGAYPLMVYANGEIETGAVILENMTPYLWGTSETYYDTETHQGKSFLLLAPTDVSSLAKNHADVLRKYYMAASKVYNIDKYMLMIYDDNVLAMNVLADAGGVFGPGDLQVSDEAAFVTTDEICLFREGKQYGPYITLQPGTYRVEITGFNLDSLSSSVTAEAGEVEIPIEVKQRESNIIEYEFSICETYTDIEFVNQCTDENEYSVIRTINLECEE